jgi:hypothetical protein
MPLPIGPLPFTLTDGTLADANQVMANFNTLLNGVNGLAPLSTAIVGSTSNVRASLAAAGTTITVAADSVTVGTALNGTSYTLTSYSQSFNGATVGAGGMDVGTLPATGYVALYAIYNPTAPAISILGTNAASSVPTVYGAGNMPAGYTASALLTVLPTNATPAMRIVEVKGKAVSIPPNTVLMTSVAIPSLTSASISAAVPANAISIVGYLNHVCGTTPGNAGVQTIIAGDAGGSGQQFMLFNCLSLTGNQLVAPFASVVLSTPQTLWWQVAVAGTSPQVQVAITQYTIA